jgi:glycosyltransferase involved in cell wall biosynthesis
MKLSVIIPCYNGESTLADQLDALAGQTWSEPWEVIVINNASTDRSREIALQYVDKIPNYRVVDAFERRGLSYARNTGVALAKAEAVVFCDADDVVAPGWLAAIGGAMEKYEFVASRFDYGKLNQNEGQDYLSGNQASGLQQLWYPPYAYHAGGCGMAVTKRVHYAIGEFDENLPRLADTDYCLRVERFGVPLQFIPEALVYIRNRPSNKGAYFQGRTWAKYNTLLYKKYRGEQMIRDPWTKYWKDWVRVIKQGLRQGVTPKWAFRFGWQIGLLEGVWTFRSAPAVVTGYKPEWKQSNEVQTVS